MRAPDAFRFDCVSLVAKTRRICDVQRHAVDCDPFAQHIASRAGNRSDDRGVVASEAIQQARLARVRAASDDDGHPFAQQRALARFRRDLLAQFDRAVDAGAQGGVGEEIDLLLRKIDRRFDVHARLGHGLGQRMHRDGKLTLHRTQRGARGLDRAAVDEIGDRFGLGQVELVVEESAAGELARLGHASAELQCAREQHVHDDRSAVAVQFENVFAGEGGRRGEIQREPGVECVSGGVAKRSEHCAARPRNFAENLARDRRGKRT